MAKVTSHCFQVIVSSHSATFKHIEHFFSAFLYCTNLLPGFQRPQNEIGQEIKPPQSKKPEQNKEALTGEDGWLV